MERQFTNVVLHCHVSDLLIDEHITEVSQIGILIQVIRVAKTRVISQTTRILKRFRRLFHGARSELKAFLTANETNERSESTIRFKVTKVRFERRIQISKFTIGTELE